MDPVQSVGGWTPYISGAFALAGALIGGFLSIGGQTYIARANQRSESKAVASAIAAEISSYLAVIETRGHVERAERLIATLEQGVNVPIRGFGAGKNEEEDLSASFPVVATMIPKIGLLGDLAGQVVAFYSHVSAVQATARAGERGEYEDMQPADKAVFLREELDVFQQQIVTGRRLVEKLRDL